MSGRERLKLNVEFCLYRCRFGASDEEGFAAIFIAANEGDVAGWEAERLGDELEQRLVGGGVDGGRGDANFQLLSPGIGDDFIPRGTRLNADGQYYAMVGFPDVLGQSHSGAFEVTKRSMPSRDCARFTG